MNYDERVKALLMRFFREFLELFFPEIAQRIDWRHKPEFLDKELPSVMTTSPKAVDLLVRVWSLDPPRRSSSQRLCLIHVEAETRKSRESLGRRVGRYLTQIDEKLNLPVMPIAIYINVGGDGIGWQTYHLTCWDYTVQTTHFPYIGLPALDGVKYSESDNPIAWALAALMKVSPAEKARIKAETESRAINSKLDDKAQALLLESINYFTELDEQQQNAYEVMLQTDEYRRVEEMKKTFLEVAREEGREAGIVDGERILLLKLVETKFGTVSDELRKLVSQLDSGKIMQLAGKVLQVERLSELKL